MPSKGSTACDIRGRTAHAKQPRYSEAKGWRGGSKDVLYTITDKRTGRELVRPGNDLRAVGPEVTFRVATRAEAEKHWQSPLHTGWKVKC